ncbi:hypothetical protein HY486_01335 [Candidatus Woesearchaeota archaeon]|nr:hypothetical protein [Candidatus Woesearchaeota archaeon]
MDESKIVHFGIIAVLSIALITVVASKTTIEAGITGYAGANYGSFGVYSGNNNRVSERGWETSYEARINRAANQAFETQRVIGLGARARYGGYIAGGSPEVERGDIANIAPYGYSPYLDRQLRYNGVYAGD